MAGRTATPEDTENLEAWAIVVSNLLDLAPRDKYQEILQLVMKYRASRPRLYLYWERDHYRGQPQQRWRGCIHRLKGLAVQVFVRDITSSHDTADARKILFGRQIRGHGSGWLGDYIEQVGWRRGKA